MLQSKRTNPDEDSIHLDVGKLSMEINFPEMPQSEELPQPTASNRRLSWEPAVP